MNVEIDNWLNLADTINTKMAEQNANTFSNLLGCPITDIILAGTDNNYKDINFFINNVITNAIATKLDLNNDVVFPNAFVCEYKNMKFITIEFVGKVYVFINILCLCDIYKEYFNTIEIPLAELFS